jgi:hypothetical protein
MSAAFAAKLESVLTRQLRLRRSWTPSFCNSAYTLLFLAPTVSANLNPSHAACPFGGGISSVLSTFSRKPHVELGFAWPRRVFQTFHAESRKSAAPLRNRVGPRSKRFRQHILGYALETTQNDPRPLDELPRLRPAATDPFEFSPIRVGQAKLPRSPSDAKLQNGIARVCNKWLLYL